MSATLKGFLRKSAMRLFAFSLASACSGAESTDIGCVLDTRTDARLGTVVCTQYLQPALACSPPAMRANCSAEGRVGRCEVDDNGVRTRQHHYGTRDQSQHTCTAAGGVWTEN